MAHVGRIAHEIVWYNILWCSWCNVWCRSNTKMLLWIEETRNTLTSNFRRNFRHTKTFFKKTHSRGKLSIYYTSRVLYIPFYSLNSQIFGTKPLPCRRFLQHYYRNTFIESHRKSIEVPQISYGGRLICSMPLPCKQKEVFTQILQIIHHFTYHSLRVCKFFCIFAKNY